MYRDEDDIEMIERAFTKLCEVLGIDPEYFVDDQPAADNIVDGLKQIAEMLEPLGIEFDHDEKLLRVVPRKKSPIGSSVMPTEGERFDVSAIEIPHHPV